MSVYPLIFYDPLRGTANAGKLTDTQNHGVAATRVKFAANVPEIKYINPSATFFLTPEYKEAYEGRRDSAFFGPARYWMGEPIYRKLGSDYQMRWLDSPTIFTNGGQDTGVYRYDSIQKSESDGIYGPLRY